MLRRRAEVFSEAAKLCSLLRLYLNEAVGVAAANSNCRLAHRFSHSRIKVLSVVSAAEGKAVRR